MNIIANLISGIKNGFLAKKLIVVQQYSKQSVCILNILLREGFIKNYKIKKNKINIYLKYKNNKSVINNIEYISKNQYIKNNNLYKNKNNLFLLSTTLGLLTTIEAKNNNIGGKLICMIF